MNKIRAIMIIEIAGRPAEYVSEAIKNHISQLKSYKGVTLISEMYSEPKKIDGPGEMHTCFSEVEIETESFSKLTDLIFDFMPASVEIIHPSTVEFNVAEATTFLNSLAGRLHKYDELAGVAQIQARELAAKLKEVYSKSSAKNKELKISTNVESSPEKKKQIKKTKS